MAREGVSKRGTGGPPGPHPPKTRTWRSQEDGHTWGRADHTWGRGRQHLGQGRPHLGSGLATLRVGAGHTWGRDRPDLGSGPARLGIGAHTLFTKINKTKRIYSIIFFNFHKWCDPL